MKKFYRLRLNESGLKDRQRGHSLEDLKKITENLDFAQRMANIGSWHYDILEDKPYWSKQIHHILGVSLQNRPKTMTEFLSFVHIEDVDHVKHSFYDFLFKRKAYKINYRIVRPSGEWRYIQQRAQFLLNEKGEPVKVIGTFQDVTANRELKIQEQQYKSLFDFNPDPVYSFDLEGNFMDCNSELLRLLGYAKKELLETPFFELVEPESKNEALFRFKEAKKGTAQRYELTARCKKGNLIYLSAVKFPIIVDGEVVGVYGVAKDVTQEKRDRLLLMEAEGKFRSMVEDSVAGAYIIQDGKFVYVNPQAKNILGFSEMEGMPFSKCIYPDDLSIVEEKISKRLSDGEMQNYEVRAVKGDGTVIYIEIHGSRSIINGKATLLGTFLDITQRKKAADQNEYLAYHDHLTSLPNRRFLEEKLEQQIALSERKNEQFAVLYLDLDRFKYINDSLGHHVGDQFLRGVARRIRDTVREQDFIAHIAGDEFVLFLPNTAKRSAVAFANAVISSLEKPFYELGYELSVTASIGISMYPDDGNEKTLLMRKADSALYRAKALGKNNVQVYSAKMTVHNFKIQSLEKDLRKAIEKKQFLLYYQPKVNLNGAIVGAEALIRWQHPKWGIIGPCDFIPLAEKMGLIKAIECWVTETVCENIKTWHEETFLQIPISINVSALRLLDKDFVDHIRRCIKTTKLDPCFLEIEIMETSFLENETTITDTFTKLKDIGVKISLDDFGRGYSSLSYLKRFKGFIDTLKIDRHFIQDLDIDVEEELITKTIIQLAQRLNIKVVAEGVETTKQLAVLAENHCDQIQGYLFSKPVPADAFKELLRCGVIKLKSPLEKKNGLEK